MTHKQALTLYIVLSRAYRAAAETDNRRIRGYGLSRSEFGVLELLLHKGPQPIQQLAQKVLLTSGSMTYVVGRLEKKGLIRRLPDEQDRRVCHADLTEAGRTMIESLFPAHEMFIHSMMSVLPGEEAEALTDQLRQLGTAIERKYRKECAKSNE